MRAVRPFLFGGLSSRTTLAAFALRKRPSVGRYFQRQRVSPAPPRHFARIVPVFVPRKPLARRRGVLGRSSRSPTALQPPLPRRGACAIIVPTWRLNCRCPSARRRWRCAFRSPNGGFGDFHPRARLFVPCSSPKLPLRVPSGAGRGTYVCSSCRKCVLRASNGFSANDGGDAVGEAAQKRARRFSTKQAC